MAFPYLESVICFMLLMYIFETYLDIRQHKTLKLPTLPKPLQGVISQDKFAKSQAYSLDLSYVQFVRAAVTTVVDILFLYHRVLPWFWKKSGIFVEHLGLDSENEILHTFGFLGGVYIWWQIMELPFLLYTNFVIEERHGFNKSSLGLFVKDIIKSVCVAVVVVPPIVAGTITIVQKGGSYLPLYLWAFMFLLSFTMVTVYPIVIAPIFNKFTPLPEGELKERLEKLAASQKFPLKKIFIVDGSLRSYHSNAYMYGFFNNKRIILFDTLVQQCKNVDEIVAVIAHELGHWKLNHTLYSFIAIQILTLLQFGGYSLVRNSKDLFLSFGFDTQPVLIGLIIFQHTVIPLQHLVSLGFNLISRAAEFQADAFAKKLGYAAPLKSALVLMQEENLAAMNSDPLHSAYRYTHPGLVERLAALDGDDNDKNKKD